MVACISHDMVWLGVFRCDCAFQTKQFFVAHFQTINLISTIQIFKKDAFLNGWLRRWQSKKLIKIIDYFEAPEKLLFGANLVSIFFRLKMALVWVKMLPNLFLLFLWKRCNSAKWFLTLESFKPLKIQIWDWSRMNDNLKISKITFSNELF